MRTRNVVRWPWLSHSTMPPWPPMILATSARPRPEPFVFVVMNGSKTDARLKAAAHAVAEAIPGARHRVLAGQTHNVSPAVLTPAVVEFLAGSTAAASARR